MASQYLTQALSAMQDDPAVATPMLDPQALAQGAKKAKDWKSANPDRSYIVHALRNAGGAVAGIPGAIAKAPANVAGLFKLGDG